MIPKKIHYCWFGRGKKPHLIRKCIESWHRVMPDYEIIEWNEDNFPIQDFTFAQQAYEEKKWAFVADICRFYACYKEGGIYLDTDVEIFKSFDVFLKHNFFSGTEVRTVPNQSDFITLDASVFGCVKEHWYAKECLEWYKDKRFRDEKGTIPGGVVQVVASMVLERYGYLRDNKEQAVKDVTIYPNTIFANITHPYNRNKIYSLHHFDGSWTDSPSRGRLFRFCRKYDLMHWYRTLERITRKLNP